MKLPSEPGALLELDDLGEVEHQYGTRGWHVLDAWVVAAVYYFRAYSLVRPFRMRWKGSDSCPCTCHNRSAEFVPAHIHEPALDGVSVELRRGHETQKACLVVEVN